MIDKQARLRIYKNAINFFNFSENEKKEILTKAKSKEIHPIAKLISESFMTPKARFKQALHKPLGSYFKRLFKK